MTQAGAGGARVSVYFGGRCDEVWTNTGLAVTYKDRLEVTAVRVGDTFRAEARSSARSGDVKADYNESARSAELASKLNAGQVPQLSAAYFQRGNPHQHDEAQQSADKQREPTARHEL